ncbi:MAG: hypothetical protein J7578_06435 [Chitinophagaceae bacterium]|nr:hypothetical protein [Chitinophagaceae bacterium]
MKKIIIILLAAFVTTAASAMPAASNIGGPHGPHGGWHGGYYRPRVFIGGGWYNPWYGPWGGYYGYPWYSYPTPPSQLDLQISTIRVNYADKIKSVRMDSDLTKQARKAKIRDLKTQRENAILDAKKNFYKY